MSQTDPELARPSPESLLERIEADEQRRSRAKLRVFFGFAPGVGKTFAMLESARRLRSDGVDVVVGLIETHGRLETAELLTGLDQLPRKSVTYRGVQLEEFDLDAALARRPAVVLVDELAHTNVPGMRHPKRYQDVLELLDAGIEVHTTLNVQHIESLNDVVAQVTSIRVRETVPDAMLDRATDVELVDLPPDALLQRLREGKVYLGEAASRAKERFFRRGNLLALRELALRRMADRVDVDVQAYRTAHSIVDTWPAAERILVCVSPSPSSARLVRAAARMAAGLRSPWVAASVDILSAAPLSASDRERREAHLRLAESLGGEVARLTGTKISLALLEYARKHNVTRVVLGKPTHPRFRDRLRGSLLDDVVRGSGDIDVHVISGDEAESEARSTEPPVRRAVEWRGYAAVAILVAAATAVGTAGRPALALPDQVMLFLLVIMITAVRFGRGPSFAASALSVAAFDFFFVPPYHTFAVSDVRHVLTFAMMFIVGMVISGLALRIRRQEQHARDREARTATLYSLSRDLGRAVTEASATDALARHLSEITAGAVVVLRGHGSSELAEAARHGGPSLDDSSRGVARWVLEHGQAAGRGTTTLPGAKVTCLPLAAAGQVLGVVAIAPPDSRRLSGDELELADALVQQGASAVQRALLAKEAETAGLKARSEEMRSSLLSAVSHDLRTPLAALTGAATTLRDSGTVLSAAERAELLDTMCEESEQLERLVANLLDMTRLDSGGIQVRREWVPFDEIVGAALTRLEAKLVGREVHTDIAPSLGLVSVDPVLLQQVFVNLFENVVKYTPADTPVDVHAGLEDGSVQIDVGDRGPGLPPGEEELVFEKFHRGPHANGGGVGLGLAICRGVVRAHGGAITATNREGGGALFRIVLPSVGQAPPVPIDGRPVMEEAT